MCILSPDRTHTDTDLTMGVDLGDIDDQGLDLGAGLVMSLESTVVLSGKFNTAPCPLDPN